jgi:hypothetical protein
MNLMEEMRRFAPAATAPDTPFREEFPFLGSPSCPVELEVLASRKFARYHRFVALHARLRGCTALDECVTVARELIDCYLENRLIWDELHHYAEHHRLLGRHPLFDEMRRRDRLARLPVKELVRRQRQIRDNIWRAKNEMEHADRPHLDAIRRERIDGYRRELADVCRLLGEEPPPEDRPVSLNNP